MYYIRTVDEGVTWKAYQPSETANKVGEATIVDAGDLATLNAAYAILVANTNFNSGAGNNDVLLGATFYLSSVDNRDSDPATWQTRCLAQMHFTEGSTDQNRLHQTGMVLDIQESDISGLTYSDVATF